MLDEICQSSDSDDDEDDSLGGSNKQTTKLHVIDRIEEIERIL